MNSFARKLTRFDNLLARGEAAALILLVSVMTVVVFLQVVYRYALTQPLYWSEEVARYLFVWISIFGAALSVQRRGHFGLDLFYKMLPNKGRRFLEFIIYLLMGVVVLVILVQGISLVEKTSLQESPAMAISMGWAYACLPVGAALMAIHLLAMIIKEAMGKLENQ
jgi:TRAP-type C4-dicarboxylate transport system permease small subunit